MDLGHRVDQLNLNAMMLEPLYKKKDPEQRLSVSKYLTYFLYTVLNFKDFLSTIFFSTNTSRTYFNNLKNMLI